MKKRRKRSAKRRMYRALTPYIMVFALAIAALFSWWLISAANDALALSKDSHEVIVQIPENASRGDVAKILKKNDVIEHTQLFKLFAFATKSKAEFPAGEYKLNSDMDYRALLRRLTSKKAALNTVMVTIPEGYEVSQIVALLDEKGVCDAAALEEAIANYDFDYEFLKGVPKGKKNRLEGYLFPDTYEFYKGDSAERVIKKFLDNFDLKFNSEMRARARELGYSTHEIITLASIVEREATASDRANIASVFHNRLNDDKYPYLESCATVQYVLGERKRVISIADTQIDNAYNTYKYKGLPPGPIANPGLDAIKATLYPNKTDYMFFALQEDGTHKFSKTYEEHLRTPKINP